MELNSVEAIVEIVRQGFGVSIVPQLTNVHWERDQDLSVIPLPGIDVERRVGLLERTRHGRMRFTAAIKEYFREGGGHVSPRVRNFPAARVEDHQGALRGGSAVTAFQRSPAALFLVSFARRPFRVCSARVGGDCLRDSGAGLMSAILSQRQLGPRELPG